MNGISGAAHLAGVIGSPVSHSLSPRLMGHWIQALDLDAAYVPFAVEASGLDVFLAGIAKSQLMGVNVTLPHKEKVLALADTASDAAKRIGAANLLTFDGDKIHADNTDAPGFLAALKPANIKYRQSTALVLGAGGAARALVYALLTSGISRLILTNRSRGRAEQLVDDLAPMAAVVDWDQKDNVLGEADLVVNATALGLNGDQPLKLDWSKARSGAVAFDSVYTPLNTQYLADARKAGLTVVDGLDMLIGQARPSFRAFYGREAPILPPVRPVLLKALGEKA
ncbi:shikimate dehydrogenase [Maricaulis parjimensis]|uniref:shikimate dehydrogenase n=1 Tax=Maricaulis parjimensis TaxID=144023 RepID=UPI00193A4E80|nr:shikimate dehydrogenase [Maricaulis parjimensis]